MANLSSSKIEDPSGKSSGSIGSLPKDPINNFDPNEPLTPGKFKPRRKTLVKKKRTPKPTPQNGLLSSIPSTPIQNSINHSTNNSHTDTPTNSTPSRKKKSVKSPKERFLTERRKTTSFGKNKLKTSADENSETSQTVSNYKIDRFDFQSLVNDLNQISNKSVSYPVADIDEKLSKDGMFFSSDNKYFYTHTSKCIRMYRVDNSELVGKISYSSRLDYELISAIYSRDPDSGRYVIVAVFSNKKILIYDAKLLTFIHEHSLDHSPSCVASSINEDYFFYSFTSPNNDTTSYHVSKVSIFESFSKKTELEVAQLPNKIAQFDYSCDGAYLFMLSDSSLYFLEIYGSTLKVEGPILTKLTKFKPSSVDPKIVIGCDTIGRILIINNIFGPKRRIATSALHWHSNPVGGIDLSSDGEFIISGGSESVLVFWQPERNIKSFLPRLSGPIIGVSISKDDKYIGITLDNNAVFIIDFDRKKIISSSIRLQKTNISSYFEVHPKKPYILMPSIPGMLQTFDLTNDKHISNLEVTSFNFISYGSDLAFPVITKSLYSEDARWLVTVDAKKTRKNLSTFLKFWQFNHSGQHYTLNTKISFPHLNNIVVDAAIYSNISNGTYAMCVTCDDELIKFWECVKTDGRLHWIMKLPSLRILNKNQDSISKVSFSHDGSTLVVSTLKQQILLVDVASSKQISDTILVPVKDKSRLLSCTFFGDNSEHILQITENKISFVNSISSELDFYLNIPDSFKITNTATCKNKFAIFSSAKYFQNAVLNPTDFLDMVAVDIYGGDSLSRISGEGSNPTSNNSDEEKLSISFIVVFSLNNQVSIESIIPVENVSKYEKITGISFVSIKSNNDSLVMVGSDGDYKIITIDPREAESTFDSESSGIDKPDGVLVPTTADNDEPVELFNSIFSNAQKTEGSNMDLDEIQANYESALVDYNNNFVDNSRDFSNQFKAFQFVPSHQLPTANSIFESLFLSFVGGLKESNPNELKSVSISDSDGMEVDDTNASKTLQQDDNSSADKQQSISSTSDNINMAKVNAIVKSSKNGFKALEQIFSF
ncbi:WD repeat-containing protein 75 [Smittium culicis]|uniref:WD repeat-containing protein 75 n=1 Tax=Smittium culicis TaxID=133412 RepID=A0A1R1Y2Z2_9FUNG|nr:WD repeat-containing protein 75 [Smittium culicis]